MTLRNTLLPALLALGLCVALADLAHAGPAVPVAPPHGAILHGGLHIGVGAYAPLRGPGPRRLRAAPPAPVGYWGVRLERIWVPGELIGYDRFGHPVYGAGYWTVQRTRVWIPGRRPGPTVVRPVGHIGFGVRLR